ncbi:aspartate racemase/maleate isomerase family protein [Chelatococcus asaccharovorans]|uniref:aspartate racemase/maleate isomerase family protein n=1 Tax=Chelatococcus asaccharovorans TaxID=28210 RepID=UPI00224C7516|nr:Asp/Glu/hydantoin racemase [Chelatococcus asaccharovorans]CAH1663033.1 Maleate isomerase [Chelatococcus asaccharovorans]CAH1682996.1 Maleate isomerase [Chelatococcus asaccharovorans]
MMTPALPAIGVILPSSNRIVERVTRSILAGLPNVDACFARVPYAGHPSDGYDLEPFRRAAAMLAEARPGIILWNATRGALLGFEPDRRLCAALERDTGIKATTTALATVALLKARGLTRIGLLSQGDDHDAQKLAETFGRQGIDIVAGAHFGISDNYAAAHIPAGLIEQQAEALAVTAAPNAILIWSTNLAGYAPAKALAARLGIPVFDSAAVGIFHALDHLAEAESARCDAASCSLDTDFV